MDVEPKAVHKDAIEGGFMAPGVEQPKLYRSWQMSGNCKTCGMPIFSKTPYDSEGALMPVVYKPCSCGPVNNFNNWPPLAPIQPVPLPPNQQLPAAPFIGDVPHNGPYIGGTGLPQQWGVANGGQQNLTLTEAVEAIKEVEGQWLPPVPDDFDP